MVVLKIWVHTVTWSFTPHLVLLPPASLPPVSLYSFLNLLGSTHLLKAVGPGCRATRICCSSDPPWPPHPPACPVSVGGGPSFWALILDGVALTLWRRKGVDRAQERVLCRCPCFCRIPPGCPRHRHADMKHSCACGCACLRHGSRLCPAGEEGCLAETWPEAWLAGMGAERPAARSGRSCLWGLKELEWTGGQAELQTVFPACPGSRTLRVQLLSPRDEDTFRTGGQGAQPQRCQRFPLPIGASGDLAAPSPDLGPVPIMTAGGVWRPDSWEKTLIPPSSSLARAVGAPHPTCKPLPLLQLRPRDTESKNVFLMDLRGSRRPRMPKAGARVPLKWHQ